MVYCKNVASEWMKNIQLNNLQSNDFCIFSSLFAMKVSDVACFLHINMLMVV